MPPAPNATKKLREVAFFLGKLRSAEPSADLTDESFDFYLSAYFAAARSVTFALQAEDKASYDAWFPTWRAALDRTDAILLDFLRDERNQVLKVGRTSRQAAVVPMPALEYQMRSSDHGVEEWSYDPQATIGVTSFSFTVGGAQRPAFEVCADGHALLARLVASFEKHLPVTADS